MGGEGAWVYRWQDKSRLNEWGLGVRYLVWLVVHSSVGCVWGSHGRTYAKSKNFRNGGAAFLDVFATALALQECKIEKILTSARHSLNEFTTNLARPMIACALKMYTWQYECRRHWPALCEPTFFLYPVTKVFWISHMFAEAVSTLKWTPTS